MTETIRTGPGLSYLMIWERQFRQLQEFRRAHGHCQVPAGGGRGVPLSRWVVRQRRLSAAGLLEKQRRAQLAEIGFDCDRQQEDWDEMFERLAAYERIHGDCLVPVRWPEDQALAGWVRFQRALRRAGRLAKRRASQLEKINFCWEPRHLAAARDPEPATRELTWDERYAQLLAFQRAYGHSLVPNAWRENLKLGRWVRTQRKARRHHSLDPELARRLDEAGFVWNARGARCHNPDWDGHEADRWERRFQKLLHFRERFGHVRVPAHWTEDRRFAAWVCRQRKMKKESRLTRERQARLEALGFVWSDPRPAAAIHEARWMKKFSQLAEFHAAHGHCDVPDHPAQCVPLRRWVKAQRDTWRAGHLRPHRCERLAALGLGPADPYRSERQRWDQHFERLLAFRERFGHCRVPGTWQEEPGLGPWVASQRILYASARLSAERVARLEEIAFSWDGEEALNAEWDADWDANFTQLMQWQEQHGTFRLSARRELFLYRWAETQRVLHRTGKLRPEREARLEAVGFPWDMTVWKNVRTEPSPELEARWQQRLEQCAQFRERFGHCVIPRPLPEDPALSDWAHNQRGLRARGKVSAERIARLDDIGFSWTGDRRLSARNAAVWEERYAELVEFQATHGHCRPNCDAPGLRVLAEWVSGQRRARRKGTLLPDRQARLDALGFQW